MAHCQASVHNNKLETMGNSKHKSSKLLTGTVLAVMASALMGGSFEPWRGVAARWATRLQASMPGTGGTGWQAQAFALAAQRGTSSHFYVAHAPHNLHIGKPLFSFMLFNLRAF